MKEHLLSQELIDVLAASFIADILKDFKDPEVQERYKFCKGNEEDICLPG